MDTGTKVVMDVAGIVEKTAFSINNIAATTGNTEIMKAILIVFLCHHTIFTHSIKCVLITSFLIHPRLLPLRRKKWVNYLKCPRK